MKSKLFLLIFVALAFVFLGVFSGSARSIFSVGSSDSAPKNVVVFSIPIGENGIHYADENSPELTRWGPTAITIAPDGTFWIADAADDRLLHFNEKGDLKEKVTTAGVVTRVFDLVVTSKEIWVLDGVSKPPKIVKLSFDGEPLTVYELPPGLRREDGLFGISLGTDGSILIEMGDGSKVIKYIDETGDVISEANDGHDSTNSNYLAHPPDLIEGENTKQGYLAVGDDRIEVQTKHDLGGLSILKTNTDGSFFVDVVEFVLNPSIQPDQKIYHYDPDGKLLGMARIPLYDFYTRVINGIAAGLDNDVYILVTKPAGGEVQKLNFSSTLPEVLPSPQINGEKEQTVTQVELSSNCRSRSDIINVAYRYWSNSVFLDTYHINLNNVNGCPERGVPRYLDYQDTYSSVPYAWGLRDQVEDFNYLMTAGSHNYFAGNINLVELGCGRGIDCSGLVSRAWDLDDHYPTCDLLNFSTPVESIYYSLQPGDILIRCNPPFGGHVIIFDGYVGISIRGYESTTEFGDDQVIKSTRLISSLSSYAPRRFNDACNKTLLPILRRDETQMNLTEPLSDPYPPASTPYP